jgi:hypothetical protein
MTARGEASDPVPRTRRYMARNGSEYVHRLRPSIKARLVTERGLSKTITNTASFSSYWVVPPPTPLFFPVSLLCYSPRSSSLQVVSHSRSCDTFDLEDHEHYTCRQKLLGAMDPNLRLLVEDLMKQVRVKIKETIESMISSQLSELTTVEQ